MVCSRTNTMATISGTTTISILNKTKRRILQTCLQIMTQTLEPKVLVSKLQKIGEEDKKQVHGTGKLPEFDYQFRS